MTNGDEPSLSQRLPSREGLRLQGRLYGSVALDALRRSIGRGARISVRFDPRDPSYALVLDEGRGAWIQVDLLPPVATNSV